MRLSVSWLKEFVDFELAPEELADTLTALGLEATVEQRDYPFEGVVVGRILQVSAIPDSDHPTVCRVDAGDGQLSIVCCAPNVAVEALVPVATVGARLPGGMQVKRAKLHGQLSEGMLCAEDELGLSGDHTGIMILSPQAKPGQDFKEYLRATQEVVLVLDLTPNRGDALSHLGVARDLAAKFNRTVRLPSIKIEEGATAIEELAAVSISAPDGCHRYAARVITGLQIGPSPSWLVQRLEPLGMRSINNVVDASNYVLMELGHPLHIFDYDRLAEQRIEVAFAKHGQTFTTLDGQKRKLSRHHLLIKDGKVPVALAGIMGGWDSEITDTTTSILIESAYFNPTVIRRGAKSLELATEASKRFERDTDIDGLLFALERVTSLIAEVAGGTVARGMIDVYPTAHEPKVIDLSVAFTNRLLGTRLPVEEMAAYLRRLGLQVEGKGQEALRCTVPPSRPELTEQVDLIEEIARLLGYDNIPAVEGVPVRFQGLAQDEQALFSQLREALIPWGFSEHLSNTLTRHDFANWFSEGRPVKLANPLSAELAFLRTSLLPGLVQAVAFNERRQLHDIQLFEIGAVHQQESKAYNLTRERFMLGLVATVGAGTEKVHWKRPAKRDLYHLKGVTEQLLVALGVPGIAFKAALARGLTAALEIASQGRRLGLMGEINSQSGGPAQKLETHVAAVELDLTEVAKCVVPGGSGYQQVAPYPVVERDIAVALPADVAAGQLLDTIRKKGGKYLRDVRVFDVYSGEGVGEGNKGLAFRLYFQSSDRTLKDAEVDVQIQRVADALQRRHKAKWRQS